MSLDAFALRAAWADVLERLPGLLPVRGQVVEIDRCESSLPPGWIAGRDERALVAPPLALARDLLRRRLEPAALEPEAIGGLGFVADGDFDETPPRDVLAIDRPSLPLPLRARSLGTLLGGLDAVALLIVGGQAAEAALIRSGLDEIARLRPVIAVRASGADDALAEIVDLLGDGGGYRWLAHAELFDGAAPGPLPETILIAVPADAPLVGARRGEPPRSLSDGPLPRAGLPPFRASGRTIPRWPASRIIGAGELPATRKLGPVETDGSLSWRWSLSSADTAIYVEVPEPGAYEISLEIPFCISEECAPTKLIVNGVAQPFLPLQAGGALIVTVKLIRHALIEIPSPVRVAGAGDSRQLGFGLSAVRTRRLADTR